MNKSNCIIENLTVYSYYRMVVACMLLYIVVNILDAHLEALRALNPQR